MSRYESKEEKQESWPREGWPTEEDYEKALELAKAAKKCNLLRYYKQETLNDLRKKLSDEDLCLLARWRVLQDMYLEYIPKLLDNRDIGWYMEAAGDIQRELAKGPDAFLGYIAEKVYRLKRLVDGEDFITWKDGTRKRY
jgi:hypothetical protein